MKVGRVFSDLLSLDVRGEGLTAVMTRPLRRLVALTGAAAGGVLFAPAREASVVVTVGARGALETWLRERLAEASARPSRRRGRVTAAPGGGLLLQTPIGPRSRPVGRLVLFSRPQARSRPRLPPGLAVAFGVAIEQRWQSHRRAVRAAVLTEITRLGGSGEPLDAVLRAFADGVWRLVPFDSLGVCLIDVERSELTIVDVPARAVDDGPRGGTRMPLAGTLMERLAATAAPIVIDDATTAGVPAGTRDFLQARSYRSVLLVPLASQGRVFGGVALVARAPAAFVPDDAGTLAELAQPLATAIEQRRLVDDGRRRADELVALLRTSRLITARLDLASVLEAISRSVTSLIGSTGCGIGLLDEARGRIVHVAAHGVRSEAWRRLSLPVGEGIIGCCAAAGEAIRVDDIRIDPRSARRDVDEEEGIRSMLCVPLTVGGKLIGVISAFSTRPGAFEAHHQEVLEAFAEQAGIAIHNARLFDESVRRARETRALLEAGRAVTASLDVQRTVRVIMEQARSVLGVASCGIMTVDEVAGDLVSVASLDLPPTMLGRVRVRVGEGIAGIAVRERRPVQSPDLFADPRVQFPDLPRASGFRSMLAVPLRVGDAVMGAIVVFHQDVHRFSQAEEDLLVALADQAAIALAHARLYGKLEQMVAERTRELLEQKRFVEVVLETLPLGVFVVDGGLTLVRANEEGERLLGQARTVGGLLSALVPAERWGEVETVVRTAFDTRSVGSRDTEMTLGGEHRIFRLTAAPFATTGEVVTHVVLLVEDVTRARRLEQQMLLTERLTTAGRLAAGVAHELNNPLATIAGCAESLLGRLRDARQDGGPDLEDFRHYLGLIEEEAYRCKDITGSLLQFVRDPGGRRAPTDLNLLVQKTLELLRHQTRFAERRLVTELAPTLPLVNVSEGQVRQVLLGLAANALEAMEATGTLTVRTRRQRDEVEVEFEDEGPGIPDEVLPRIFDPFFTTKPPGQGTGLGLAIAQGIVTDHGGRIDVTSRPGKGSTFRVILPA